MNEQIIVTKLLVPDEHRLAVTAELFGTHFPLQLEPVIYAITDQMAADYHGGYWDFYTLSNAGFYMAPSTDHVFAVHCANCFQGELSGDALGITSCLYAFSNLSFTGDGGFPRQCARQYHLLRGYMYDHVKVAKILGAID